MSLDISLHEVKEVEVFSSNITHNLGRMAGEAGIYVLLWRPEEIGVKFAYQMIEPLKEALELLKTRPEHFKQFDAQNGWGVYDDFLKFVEKVIQGCDSNPEALIKISR